MLIPGAEFIAAFSAWATVSSPVATKDKSFRPLPQFRAFAIKAGSISLFAPVAQLDRALPSEGRGQGFESLRARQRNGHFSRRLRRKLFTEQ